jgi:ATP-dependent Clp protease ATP-binding subunit ClpC
MGELPDLPPFEPAGVEVGDSLGDVADEPGPIDVPKAAGDD